MILKRVGLALGALLLLVTPAMAGSATGAFPSSAANDTGTNFIPQPFAMVSGGSAPCVIGSAGGSLATGSVFVTPSFTTTRPADTTAYALGDLVANSATAGSVVPLSWTVTGSTTGSAWIFKASINASNTALVNDVFVLHLYKTAPTLTVGDNGVFAAGTTTAGWICDITVTMNSYAFSDGVSGSGVPNTSNACMVVAPASSTIYGLLETRQIFTPTSASTFAVALEDQEN